ncbi:MAG: MarR family transcriptional regulator [Candidatus Omnitrophota bacterium]|nr:MAG: MarR family transcriptional regulator [Candidatus Omnitrophota bacterium]
MDYTERIAQEVSVLVPKLAVGVWKKFFEIEELTNRQIIVLMFLYENKSVKISDIARGLFVSFPTITGIVDRLVKKGYLLRGRNSKDRRIVYINLSNKGQNFVKRFKENIRKRWQKILSYLTREEQESYLSILKKILKTIEEKNA